MIRKNSIRIGSVLLKRLLPVLLIISVVFSFSSCGENEANGKKEGKLQEKTVITKNKIEKYSGEVFFDDVIGFVRCGTNFSESLYDERLINIKNTSCDDYAGASSDGYCIHNVPKSILSIGKYIFYLNEDRELHRINTESGDNEIIIEMMTDAKNIIYSDLYMIIYGAVDGYTYSYNLYDIKKEAFIDNETFEAVFSDDDTKKFAGLFGDKLCYIDNAQHGSTNSTLKYLKLTDNSTVDIYTSVFKKNTNYIDLVTGEHVIGDGENREETVAGSAVADVLNNYLYYKVDYSYYDKVADGRKEGWKLMRYDFATAKNDECYNEITADYTKVSLYSEKTLSAVFALNGKLYGCLQKEPGIGALDVFCIESGEIKYSADLPVGEKLYVGENSVYYKTKDKNIIINGDKILKVDDSITEASGFLGCYEGKSWYSTDKSLCILNEKNLKPEEKVMFNGFIISASGDKLICYGKPLEKHEVTGPYGEKSSSVKEGEVGIYQVSISEIESEEIIRDVFEVSESDKEAALAKVDDAYGLEIMMLVSSPVIKAKDTTYEEGVVTVTVTGKFRMTKDLWVENTAVFTVDLSDGSCKTSDLWDAVVSSYNNGL